MERAFPPEQQLRVTPPLLSTAREAAADEHARHRRAYEEELALRMVRRLVASRRVVGVAQDANAATTRTVSSLFLSGSLLLRRTCDPTDPPAAAMG